MRPSGPFRTSPITLAFAGCLVSWSGCGNNLPPNGSAAAPIDLKRAAEQNKGMEDYYKSNPKAINRSTGGRR